MAAPIPLRPDYDGPGLRALARQSRDADQTRRLLALASIYDGGSRRSAARLGGVGLQIVRDWVLRFNAYGPEGLIDRKAPGQAPKLNAAQRQALAEKVEGGPIPAVDGVVRWDSASCWPVPATTPRMATPLRILENFPAELAAVRAALPPGTNIELW